MFLVIDFSTEDGISNISHFKETENTTQKKDISVVYVKSTVNNGTCQQKFVKFHTTADFSLNDAPKSNKTVQAYSNKMKALHEKCQILYNAGASNVLKICKPNVKN